MVYKPYFILKTFNTQSRQHLVSRNTDLCIEGFQSSGNSYLSHLIQYIRPDLYVAHHTHSLSNVRQALKFDIPVVVPIRNPGDAIASYIFRFHNSDVCENHLFTYLDFYRYITDHRDDKRIIVLPFEILMEDTPGALNYVSAKSHISMEYDDLEIVQDEVLTYLKVWPRIYADDSAKNISLPHPFREERKMELEQQLTQFDLFKECVELYTFLVDDFKS